MAKYRSLRDLDWSLIAITLVLSAVGTLQIYSTTRGTVWAAAWWKQALWVAAGLLLMWVLASIDYHTLVGHAYVYYVLALVGLVLVLLVGRTVSGGQRWLGFGPLYLQVSEFVKIVILLVVARYLAELKTERPEVRDLVRLGALIGVPVALVMKQPDLGTALTYLPILAVGVFLAGLRWKYVAVMMLAAVLLLPLGWLILQDYQKARLVSFLDPARDPRGSGYQTIQSKIAVGSGGMWGKGVARGSQTQLRFLPVPHTDFVFSAFAEEHGFVGVVVVLGLYFVLLMQILQNAQTAPDRAGVFICMGVCALLLFHVLVNIGMVVGRMPVTGIPLPLMSYGGSNIWSTFLMLGLVHNVRLRRFVS